MDKLDQLISEKQAELERLQKEIDDRAVRHERVLIELEALKAAAQARPVSQSKPTGSAAQPAPKPKARAARSNGKSRGGRSAGAISNEWRKVLAAAQSLHRRLSYLDFQQIAATLDIKTKMPNVRERVRSMTENGLLTGNAESGFLVTAEAARRFGFDKNQAA